MSCFTADNADTWQVSRYAAHMQTAGSVLQDEQPTNSSEVLPLHDRQACASP
jgi:hypothetical protein